MGRQIIVSSPGGVFDAMIAEVTMLDTGSPTRQASEEAKAIATKYGLESCAPKSGLGLQSVPACRLEGKPH